MKTEQLIAAIKETNTITESQLNLLKRRMNNGEKIDVTFIWDGEIQLSPEQNKKGIEFLRDQWQTKTGKERKNNPFGYREQEVINNFTHFELAGFYDTARYGQRSFFIPLYRCCGDGCFEYYYNGTVNIVG